LWDSIYGYNSEFIHKLTMRLLVKFSGINRAQYACDVINGRPFRKKNPLFLPAVLSFFLSAILSIRNSEPVLDFSLFLFFLLVYLFNTIFSLPCCWKTMCVWEAKKDGTHRHTHTRAHTRTHTHTHAHTHLHTHTHIAF